MKNAIRFIATGLVISLASASFAQKGHTVMIGKNEPLQTEMIGKNVTLPTEMIGKNEVIAAPENVTNKGRQNPDKATNFIKQRHENRRGDTKFEQFQNTHPQLASLFTNHRAAFVRMGVSPREVMHRANARRVTTR